MTSSQREFGQFPNMFIHTLLSQTAPSCLHRHRLGIQNKPTPHAKICPSHENTPTKLTQTWHIDTLPSRNTRKHWFHVVHFLQKKKKHDEHSICVCVLSLILVPSIIPLSLLHVRTSPQCFVLRALAPAPSRCGIMLEIGLLSRPASLFLPTHIKGVNNGYYDFPCSGRIIFATIHHQT